MGVPQVLLPPSAYRLKLTYDVAGGIAAPALAVRRILLADAHLDPLFFRRITQLLFRRFNCLPRLYLMPRHYKRQKHAADREARQKRQRSIANCDWPRCSTMTKAMLYKCVLKFRQAYQF
ncbi:hypothetical protein Ndes2526B_g02299 [Nannochloris sp. 'desiccata']